MISTSYTISKKEKRKIYGIIGALITLIVPFFLMIFNDNNHLETDQSLCPFKMLTGFPCPGCGITKSLVYFYQGDMLKSVTYHVLGPLVIGFSIVSVVVLTVELVTKKEYFNSILFNKKLAYSLGAFLVIYHLVRIILFIKNNSFDEIIKQSIWK